MSMAAGLLRWMRTATRVTGNYLLEKFQPFPTWVWVYGGQTGDIPTRSRQASFEPAPNRIARCRHDDWDCPIALASPLKPNGGDVRKNVAAHSFVLAHAVIPLVGNVVSRCWLRCFFPMGPSPRSLRF